MTPEPTNPTDSVESMLARMNAAMDAIAGEVSAMRRQVTDLLALVTPRDAVRTDPRSTVARALDRLHLSGQIRRCGLLKVERTALEAACELMTLPGKDGLDVLALLENRGVQVSKSALYRFASKFRPVYAEEALRQTP